MWSCWVWWDLACLRVNTEHARLRTGICFPRAILALSIVRMWSWGRGQVSIDPCVAHLLGINQSHVEMEWNNDGGTHTNTPLTTAEMRESPRRRRRRRRRRVESARGRGEGGVRECEGGASEISFFGLLTVWAPIREGGGEDALMRLRLWARSTPEISTDLIKSIHSRVDRLYIQVQRGGSKRRRPLRSVVMC